MVNLILYMPTSCTTTIWIPGMVGRVPRAIQDFTLTKILKSGAENAKMTI